MVPPKSGNPRGGQAMPTPLRPCVLYLETGHRLFPAFLSVYAQGGRFRRCGSTYLGLASRPKNHATLASVIAAFGATALSWKVSGGSEASRILPPEGPKGPKEQVRGNRFSSNASHFIFAEPAQ